MSLITDENERIEGQGGDREAAISQVPAPCDCSIALTEGELTDLQGIESWLSASDDVCPPDPLGRGGADAVAENIGKHLGSIQC